ncbi:hypothetical protein B0H14DRAFT_2858638, partial [Mycena olivaceomarginata]
MSIATFIVIFAHLPIFLGGLLTILADKIRMRRRHHGRSCMDGHLGLSRKSGKDPVGRRSSYDLGNGQHDRP